MTFKTQEEIKQKREEMEQKWSKDDQEHAEAVFSFCKRMTRRQRKKFTRSPPRSPKRKAIWSKLQRPRFFKIVRLLSFLIMERLTQDSFFRQIFQVELLEDLSSTISDEITSDLFEVSLDRTGNQE
jgi:hypothetical protein